MIYGQNVYRGQQVNSPMHPFVQASKLGWDQSNYRASSAITNPIAQLESAFAVLSPEDRHNIIVRLIKSMAPVERESIRRKAFPPSPLNAAGILQGHPLNELQEEVFKALRQAERDALNGE